MDYEVEISNEKGEFYRLECPDALNLHCSIPILSLIHEPFNLKDGSLMVLRVRTANQERKSRDYAYKLNAKVEGLPGKISKLQLIESS